MQNQRTQVGPGAVPQLIKRLPGVAHALEPDLSAMVALQGGGKHLRVTSSSGYVMSQCQPGLH